VSNNIELLDTEAQIKPLCRAAVCVATLQFIGYVRHPLQCCQYHF